MFKEITLTSIELIKLLSSKRRTKAYLKILKEHQRLDDQDSIALFLTIDSYEKEKEKYGYKTKSGLWKALYDLNYCDLIDIEDNNIYIKGLKIVL